MTRSEILLKCFERIPEETITDPKVVNRALMAADELGTLISPCAAINDIPQMHAISFRYVFLDHRVGNYGIGTDCYKSGQFCKGNDDRALSQEGILKIWKAASGRDVSVTRLDDHNDPLYAEVQVVVGMKGLDGREEQYMASRTVDLRPDSPEALAMKPAMLRNAQTVVARNAESKARLRAIRKALALRQVYQVGQLERPFIIPALVPQIDVTDPAVRRLVSAHALGIVDDVYGRTPEPVRELPEATEPPPANVTPDGEYVEADVVAPEMSATDETLPPVGPACACPCGCCAPITDTNATKSMAMLGAPRCPDCFPSPKTFDAVMHEGAGNLDLPKRPDLTAAKVIGMMK